MRALEANLARVRDRIAGAAARAGRDAAEVRIVAVTKGFGPEAVALAAAVGLTDIGENRVKDAARKRATGTAGTTFPSGGADRATTEPTGLVWHLIGHLQTNKALEAAEIFDRIHTVDSRRVADALDVAGERLGKNLTVLVQVKTSDEAAKSGVAPGMAADLVAYVAARRHLAVEGLMTVPAYTADPEGARPFFRILRQLRDEIGAQTGLDLPELSMGMSHDFEVAVEEGATWVRLGTALFGERPGLSLPVSPAAP